MTPRPFPVDENYVSSETFRSQATADCEIKAGESFAGAVPEEKQTINCQKHGQVKALYIPAYKSPADGLRGLPAISHSIVYACKHCIKDRQELLFAEYQAEQAEKARIKREEIMLETIESFGVSLRNAGKQLHELQPINDSQSKAIQKCSDIYNSILEKTPACNLILSGSVGTGKTMIASALVASLIRCGKTARIATVSKIIRVMKSTWRKDSEETEDGIIKKLVSLDVLVIDEIGVQFGSDTEKLFLFEIIDGRYNKMKPTILISNLAVAGIRDLIGERCLNRLKEDGGSVVAFDFESQRGIK